MAKFKRQSKSSRMAEIQEAAKKVFLEKGFRYTTMEDVVKNTTLSKGGVYQYYKTTKAILFDIMQNGNYFRYERTEKIVQEAAGAESLAEVMTEACMAKLFDEVPEKKLYLMFLAEIPYDRDYEALYFELETQAFELLIKTLHCTPQQERELMGIIRNQDYYLFKIFHGMLVMHELFSDKDVFNQNKEKIHTMILTAMQNFFDRHQDVFKNQPATSTFSVLS